MARRRLTAEQKARVDSIARNLAQCDTPFPDFDPNHTRGEKLRKSLMNIGGMAITEWSSRLPDPRVSLELLEVLAQKNRYMAHLAVRITVDNSMGCWALPLSEEHTKAGVSRYPTVTFAELGIRGMSAHRFVWKTFIDPNLQRNDYIDHLCRSHACCNPGHLEPVTPAVNTARGNHARQRIAGQDTLFRL